MEELVKHGYDWKEKDDWGWTLLHEVAALGNARAIEWVCERTRCMTNASDRLGRTPLLTALIAGVDITAVEELIKNGEDPTEEDDVGRSSAEAAILYCSPDVIQLILEAIVEKCGSEADLNGESLYSIAADHPQSQTVIRIIDEKLK